MKNISLLVTLLLGTFLAVPTHAQTIQIEVQKSTTKNLKATHGGYYTKKQGTEGVSYTITISNHSSGSLSNAIVKWYILVSSARYVNNVNQSMRVVNGTQNINLGRGQDVTFDTDPVNLNVTKYNTSYGYNSRYGDQVDGYVVKVI